MCIFSYFLNYIDDSLILLYTGQPGGFLGLLSILKAILKEEKGG